MKGLVIAGTGSGVGKTVTSLAAMTALQDRGLDVQPYKVGPDYIDPSHHEAVTGKPSRCLDPFMMTRDDLLRNFHRGTGDVAVIEGVMGLYDGGENSTAHVADLLDLPVVLVLDGSSTAESIAAVAHGFATYGDADVRGVIATKAGSEKHRRLLRDALDGYDYSAVLPRLPDAEIPDRHLGLHMSHEHPLPRDALDELAEHLDPDGILDAAREPAPPPETTAPEPPRHDATVAVARDPAFNFYYPATLELLENAADVKYFSPLDDPFPDADAAYLGGGYPELHAEQLSRSPALHRLADRAADGMPIYGECGGMMALAETLETADGETHDMAGALPLRVTMTETLQAVGYVEARLSDPPFPVDTDTIRGHEYHYSTLQTDADAAYDVTRGTGVDGRDGLHLNNVLGSYTHLHPATGAPVFEGLLRAAEDYRQGSD